MELDHKKNLSAAVYIDNVKIIDLDNSMIYGKFDEKDEEAYFFIKNSHNGRSIKMIIKKYAEEVEEKDI